MTHSRLPSIQQCVNSRKVGWLNKNCTCAFLVGELERILVKCLDEDKKNTNKNVWLGDWTNQVGLKPRKATNNTTDGYGHTHTAVVGLTGRLVCQCHISNIGYGRYFPYQHWHTGRLFNFCSRANFSRVLPSHNGQRVTETWSFGNLLCHLIHRTKNTEITRNMGQSPTWGRPGGARASLDQLLARVKTWGASKPYGPKDSLSNNSIWVGQYARL